MNFIEDFDVKEFKKRMVDVRERKKISQEKLAKLTGLKQPDISDYEKGKTVPSIATLMKIASALRTSIDYLAGMKPVDSDD